MEFQELFAIKLEQCLNTAVHARKLTYMTVFQGYGNK